MKNKTLTIITIINTVLILVIYAFLGYNLIGNNANNTNLPKHKNSNGETILFQVSNVKNFIEQVGNILSSGLISGYSTIEEAENDFANFKWAKDYYNDIENNVKEIQENGDLNEQEQQLYQLCNELYDILIDSIQSDYKGEPNKYNEIIEKIQDNDIYKQN